ncbi:MAG TPA: Ku protein [Burkholderiaceae bacterium]
MPRSIWKGAISFGLVHIPVEVLSAEKPNSLDLKMVDKRDFAPIGYKRINKDTGKEVEWDNIVKAYEYDDNQLVALSDEDLRRANVKATQTIDIANFIDTEEIDSTYFEQPYYLKPGKGGDKVYALLLQTLKKSGKIGIAQVVMHTRQHLVALIPRDDIIIMNTLRYPAELRQPEDLDMPELKKAGISDKEVKMAMALVEGMAEPWDPSVFHDTYKDDVLKLVKQKIKDKQTHVLTEPSKDDQEPKSAKVIDLMALLKQSLNGKGKGKAAAADDEDDEEEDSAPAKKEPAAKTAAKATGKTVASIARKKAPAKAPVKSVAKKAAAKPAQKRARA